MHCSASFPLHEVENETFGQVCFALSTDWYGGHDVLIFDTTELPEKHISF